MTNQRASATEGATPIEPVSAHDRMITAISILQCVMLARDSATDGKEVWGSMFMPDSALEHAIGLLVEILPDLEEA